MSQSNNITIAVLDSSLKIGGAERVTSEICTEFAKRDDYKIIVCHLKEPGEIGIELERLGIKTYSNILKRKINPFAIFKILRILKENGVNVIYLTDNNNAMFYGVIISKLSGCKIINAIHNTNNIYKNKLIMPLRRALNRQVDRIVALSETHKNYLVSGSEKIVASKIVNIFNGIDAEKFSAIKKKNNKPTIGIIASLTPRKDHTTFLLAADKVRKTIEDIEFLIVGDGPEKNNIEFKINELDLGNIVKLTGNINDVTQILPNLDIVVLSSKPIGETFPVSILEAQASGIPVICTDVGSVREMVHEGHTGFLVSTGDYEKIAQRIIQLVQDNELARNLGEKARIFVSKNFTKKRMIDSYDILFKSMVSNG